MARVRVHPPLIVDELTIREFRMDDVQALDDAIVRNLPYLRPWLGPWINAEPIGIERRQELMQSWVDSYASGGDHAIGIFINDQLVGGTGLHDRNAPADVEIGYWVDEGFQGRGIATRVTRALTDFALQHEEVERVLIIHAANNDKSRRIPERLGFVEIPSVGECGGAPGVTWAMTRRHD